MLRETVVSMVGDGVNHPAIARKENLVELEGSGTSSSPKAVAVLTALKDGPKREGAVGWEMSPSGGFMNLHPYSRRERQSTIAFPGALPPTSIRQKYSSPRTRQITFPVSRKRLLSSTTLYNRPRSHIDSHIFGFTTFTIELRVFGEVLQDGTITPPLCLLLSSVMADVKGHVSQSGRIILRKDAIISVWTALMLFLEGVLAWASLIDKA
ncbi:hypothetical protein BDZ89DRAFT_1158432 [Hymenopellis radicata]|nr:hypothetical protein BDZ89DRAFT_1158432 [Hymenopellis radicata]